VNPLGLLPLLAFIVVFLVLLQIERDQGGAFISTCLAVGVYAVLVTEALSLVRGVSVAALTVVWAAPVVTGTAWLVGKGRRAGQLVLPVLPVPSSTFLRLLAAGLALILVLTAVVSWFAPPNTWDALTYHMDRVAHWAQTGTIGHYASGIDAQNFMPPAASIFGLQVYLLGAGDRLVAFVQWTAMVGCLIVAARIAARLGAGERGRWFAASFAATLPTGILQATSVTTDYVVALWVVIAACLVVELWRSRGGAREVVELGMAAGLALATKQTAVTYLLPFAALVAVVLLRRPDRRMLIGPSMVSLLLVVLLNIGHLSRNVATYGNLGGLPRRVDGQTNQIFDGRVLVSNVLRSASLHLGTPLPHVNKAMALALRGLHDAMNLDINDPRTTAEGDFRVRPPAIHETRGGNLPHALLLIALVPLAWLARRRLPGGVTAYVVVVVLTFLLLNAVFQWKPTAARYHLAFFVLLAPAVGVILEALPWRVVSEVAVAILMLSSLPWLLGNHSRPLLSNWPDAAVDSVLSVPRQDLYFANAPYLARPYREITSLIRLADCRSIAVALPGQGIEYPLWALLGLPRPGIEIGWLVGGTPSARYTDPDFAPCAVICEKCPETWVTVRGLSEVYRFGTFRLFMDRP
jgi:hypothetical protein